MKETLILMSALDFDAKLGLCGEYAECMVPLILKLLLAAAPQRPMHCYLSLALDKVHW